MELRVLRASPRTRRRKEAPRDTRFPETAHRKVLFFLLIIHEAFSKLISLQLFLPFAY
jgi:hypothetical protein